MFVCCVCVLLSCLLKWHLCGSLVLQEHLTRGDGLEQRGDGSSRSRRGGWGDRGWRAEGHRADCRIDAGRGDGDQCAGRLERWLRRLAQHREIEGLVKWRVLAERVVLIAVGFVGGSGMTGADWRAVRQLHTACVVCVCVCAYQQTGHRELRPSFADRPQNQMTTRRGLARRAAAHGQHIQNDTLRGTDAALACVLCTLQQGRTSSLTALLALCWSSSLELDGPVNSRVRMVGTCAMGSSESVLAAGVNAVTLLRGTSGTLAGGGGGADMLDVASFDGSLLLALLSEGADTLATGGALLLLLLQLPLFVAGTALSSPCHAMD